MRGVIFLVLIIFTISNAAASCNSSQIDINSASLGDLDKLIGIGPVYAQGIIDSRPFSSVDDLDRVKGIGPKTLEKIKSQGLACVNSENSGENTLTSEDAQVEKENTVEVVPLSDASANDKQTVSKKNVVPEKTNEIILEEPKQEAVTSESIINLNEDIPSEHKSEIIYESKNELIKKYAPYAFSLFILFVLVIVLLRK